MEKVNETHPEPHSVNVGARLNWLRAGVLGANDGIVSVAGLVVGVAGANNSTTLILTAGLAGIVAGAISMAAGEYVSVSSSRDTEKALLEKEKFELKHYPEAELDELTAIYERKGLSHKTALTVAEELTKKDVFAAHVDAELKIDPENLTSPSHAAFASAIAFLAGAAIPLAFIIILPESIRIVGTFISVLIALAITGTISALIGGASIIKAVTRVVAGGALAMVVTYGIGRLLGVAGI